MLKEIIFAILFLYIKGETWLPLVYKNNISLNDGFAGDYRYFITDFYLCSKRHYRVHFINENRGIWSQEYSNCEPVGDGRPIDGIAIEGGKSYQVRLFEGKGWLPNVSEYNISSYIDGLAGKYGEKIDGISVCGDEYYRVAYGKNLQIQKK